MSSIRMKKEYAILLVIIILLVVFLLFQGKDKMHYQAPELEAIKLEDIDKIDIKKNDVAIQLVKKDEKWVIATQNFPTDPEKIKKITDVVTTLSLTELISKTKNYSMYDLSNDKAIQVIVYQKEKVLRDFQVGKRSGTYGHTFVKIKDDENVYHALGAFQPDFDVKPNDLRDKSVLKFDPNEISSLEVQKDGQTYLFTKNVKTPPAAEPPQTDPGKEKKEDADKTKTDDNAEKTPITTTPEPPKPEEISWTMPDGQKGDNVRMDGLINQLAELSCQDFIEGKTKEDFKDQVPVFKVKFKGSKDYELLVFARPGKPVETTGNPPSEEEGDYPALSSENPYPFSLSAYKVDQFIKNPGDLIFKVEKEDPQTTPALPPQPAPKRKVEKPRPVTPKEKKQEK